MSTIIGKPYIKRSGTITRTTKAGIEYSVPAFEIRVLFFGGQRDELVVGALDYSEALLRFAALGFKRYGTEVRVER